MERKSKERRQRRSFSKEFKAEVVELCRQPGNTVASVAQDLDLTDSAVREWVRQADIDAGRRDGLTTAEREELGRLRRENRTLREERDILKRATAFFARETR
jgi:transposase